MKLLLFVPVLVFFFTSCNNQNKNLNLIANTEDLPALKKDSFFPVTSFIKGQIRQFDSLNVTPLHTITVGNKTDSQWIKKDELKNMLASFILPEIKETNMVNYFKETSFNDQTLNAITFTYDPIKPLPDSILLRHWDVYIDPESGKVTMVYLVKQIKEKAENKTLQLTWKTDKYAMIKTIVNKADGSTKLLKEDKFIWKFN